MQIGNRWNFSDPQLQDFVRAVLEVLNGNIDSSNLTSVTSSGLTGKYCVSFLFDSHLIDEELFGIFYFPTGVSITKIMLFIGETSDGIINVDLCKNDVEQNKLATLSANTVSELTTFGSSIDFLSTDKFSLKIKDIGSEASPGQSLTAVIYWEA